MATFSLNSRSLFARNCILATNKQFTKSPLQQAAALIYQSFRIENTRTISNISTSIFRKRFTPIFALNSKNYNCFVLNLCVFNLLSKMVEFENIVENSL